MALSPQAAQLADGAIATVAAAVARTEAAIEAEWTLITWATGSESAAAARRSSLEASRKILADLRARRPALTDAGLAGFLDLAAAAADVSASIKAAQRMTAAGLQREVVAPTLAELDPTNLGGLAGKVALAGALALVVVFALRR